jgi:CxxC motif-containing protein (DUF1111 family)
MNVASQALTHHRSARQGTFARNALLTVLIALTTSCSAIAGVVDRPARPGDPPRAGGPLPGLTQAQQAFFDQATETFKERDTVSGHDGTSQGLGPRFNLDGCAGCHAFPFVGGSSPPLNRQPIVAHAEGATNGADIPFLRSNGPTIEVRFKWLMDTAGHFLIDPARPGRDKRVADGGVHALFTIAGRKDADPNCRLVQPPFKQAFDQDNVTLRIPTPLFGLGLIEAIDESIINRNAAQTVFAAAKARQAGSARAADFDLDDLEFKGMVQTADLFRMLGIHGRPGRGRENHSGNDGTITRFGWKAQNKSLLLFAGEAYNVEQGVTNELFPNERDEEPVPLPAPCKSNAVPEDQPQATLVTDPSSQPPKPRLALAPSDIVQFAAFMRLLAPPKPACDLSRDCAAGVVRGSKVFDSVYCSACHIRQLKLGQSSIAAISGQRFAVLYSDLLLHQMGSCPPRKDHSPVCLADGVQQGQAQGDEFRTAPLWGVGQRLFFLHDGRATDLPSAILAHRGPGSEANEVIKRYAALPDAAKQDLIDFLRSL